MAAKEAWACRYRHAISDESWEQIRDLLPGKSGDPGVTAADNRLFVDAVMWIAKTGAPWRDLPERRSRGGFGTKIHAAVNGLGARPTLEVSQT